MFKDNEKEFPMKPLDKKDAENLELRSKDYKDQFQSLSPRERKIKITQDMQAQLEKNCPIDPVT